MWVAGRSETQRRQPSRFEGGRQGGRVYLHLVRLWGEHGKDVKKRIWQSDKEGKKAKYVVLGIELRRKFTQKCN